MPGIVLNVKYALSIFHTHRHYLRIRYHGPILDIGEKNQKPEAQEV